MEIVRCKNGHYYDRSRFSQCPHCGGESTPEGGEAQTVANNSIREQVTVAKNRASGTGEIREAMTEMHQGARDAKTIGFYDRKIGIDPVVGWLVCVKGPEKGRDYRLHEGRNFIGRSAKMDVCIVEDDQISKSHHAALIFEPRKCEFILTRGEGTDIILNGTPVSQPERLKDHDIIELGQTVLEFIAYCKGGSRWEEK